VRVLVGFQFFRFVRMTVRAVFLLMLVLVSVFMDVVVFMSVRGLVVRVLM
jgi:hypothetical protein